MLEAELCLGGSHASSSSGRWCQQWRQCGLNEREQRTSHLISMLSSNPDRIDYGIIYPGDMAPAEFLSNSCFMFLDKQTINNIK